MLLVSSDGHIDFANAEIKKRTPDGEAVLAEGAPYRDAIKTLIDNRIIDTGELTNQAMLKRMTETALEDGFSEEYSLTNGDVFVRTAKAMSGGAILLTRQDVTEDRRRLREIRDLNERLEHQVTVSNAANEELRAFAYATSHDLKAPTNTITLLTDALGTSLEGKMTEDDLEFFADLRSTNQRMSQLIEDVLDYTNAIGTDIQREHVDLSSVLSGVVEDLRADIAASGAEISQASLPMLKAHPGQMHQLIQNLLSNAIKFSSPDRKPKISVDVADAAEGFIAFTVSDNGIGIDDRDKKKIFKLFSRLHGYSDVAGTGLGLAICQRIAFNHGGGIEVSSELGLGSTFTVTLKVEQDDQQPDADR